MKGFLSDFLRDLSALVGLILALVQSIRYLKRWWPMRRRWCLRWEKSPASKSSLPHVTDHSKSGRDNSPGRPKFGKILLAVFLIPLFASLIVPATPIQDEKGVALFFYAIVALLGLGSATTELAFLTLSFEARLLKSCPAVTDRQLFGIIIALSAIFARFFVVLAAPSISISVDGAIYKPWYSLVLEWYAGGAGLVAVACLLGLIDSIGDA